MINGQQCHAARALIDLTRDQLANLCGLSKDTITRFERKEVQLDGNEMQSLQASLESLGAIFINEGSDGIGVRRKFTVVDAHQIADMESEGGAIVANDILLH